MWELDQASRGNCRGIGTRARLRYGLARRRNAKSVKPGYLKEGYAMRCKYAVRMVLAIFVVFATANTSWSQTAQVLAIRAGRLFDSNTGQESAHQVVIVQGERILEVGPENQIKIPAGAL